MVTAPRTPIESHAVHSERLMRHAWERLEEGDRLQASEKCWGAVAHALKAVSQRYGWRHGRHFHNNVIALHLSTLTGDETLFVEYAMMEALHINYYNDVKTEQELRRYLEAGADLLLRIAAAADKIGPTPPAPSYDRRARSA